tara:strand:- start:93 stop:398 length:306 start_codon:yes stop_codon:yes gene_type:complete
METFVFVVAVLAALWATENAVNTPTSPEDRTRAWWAVEVPARPMLPDEGRTGPDEHGGEPWLEDTDPAADTATTFVPIGDPFYPTKAHDLAVDTGDTGDYR